LDGPPVHDHHPIIALYHREKDFVESLKAHEHPEKATSQMFVGRARLSAVAEKTRFRVAQRSSAAITVHQRIMVLIPRQ
jgi:hypothetical protein